MNQYRLRYTDNIIWTALNDVDPFSLKEYQKEVDIKLDKWIFISNHAIDRFEERFFINILDKKSLAIFVLHNIKNVFVLNNTTKKFENKHLKINIRMGEIDAVAILKEKENTFIMKTIWVDNSSDNFANALIKQMKKEQESKELDQRLINQFFKSEAELMEFHSSSVRNQVVFVRQHISKKNEEDQKMASFSQIMKDKDVEEANDLIDFVPNPNVENLQENSFESEIADLFKNMD